MRSTTATTNGSASTTAAAAGKKSLILNAFVMMCEPSPAEPPKSCHISYVTTELTAISP